MLVLQVPGARAALLGVHRCLVSDGPIMREYNEPWVVPGDV
jgi:hypothetical protein